MGSKSSGFSKCGSQALEHGLSSCGAQTQLLRGMRGLPGSGIKPVSPALAGGFLINEPSGKAFPGFLALLWGQWLCSVVKYDSADVYRFQAPSSSWDPGWRQWQGGDAEGSEDPPSGRSQVETYILLIGVNLEVDSWVQRAEEWGYRRKHNHLGKTAEKMYTDVSYFQKWNSSLRWLLHAALINAERDGSLKVCNEHPTPGHAEQVL